jgi:hypothetical protein
LADKAGCVGVVGGVGGLPGAGAGALALTAALVVDAHFCQGSAALEPQLLLVLVEVDDASAAHALPTHATPNTIQLKADVLLPMILSPGLGCAKSSPTAHIISRNCGEIMELVCR